MSACNTGYALAGSVCVDINECATNNGGCAVGQTCTNTQGGSGCGCAAGLTSCGGSCVAGPGNQYRAEGNANDAVGGAHCDFATFIDQRFDVLHAPARALPACQRCGNSSSMRWLGCE